MVQNRVLNTIYLLSAEIRCIIYIYIYCEDHIPQLNYPNRYINLHSLQSLYTSPSSRGLISTALQYCEMVTKALFSFIIAHEKQYLLSCQKQSCICAACNFIIPYLNADKTVFNITFCFKNKNLKRHMAIYR